MEMQDTIYDLTPEENGHHGAAVMYIIITGVFFALLTVVFLFFPRTSYSQLEKRDLAEFPDVSDFEKIKSDPRQLTADISTWFSDTEPYRDLFMTMSMKIRGAMKGDFRSDEETVSFRPADMAGNSSESQNDGLSAGELAGGDTDDINDGMAKIANAGIVIVGKGDNVRALMAFGGLPSGGGGYVDLMNTLANDFPAQNVYAMVAPIATEYYLPEKAASASKPQKPLIYSIRDRLSPKVKFVDIYDELLQHKKEDIYLRTDHHWSPLGGYYAAKRLAETAGVPFRGLDAYDTHVIHRFVGSMYGYSKDISVKNAPEDFVYYVPNGVTYSAEFISYTLDRDFRITGETKPFKSSYFKKFNDGSGNAYLTFMGSDQSIVKVKTSTPGTRKLLIIKDSYGNALPSNLFYSFNEVHVIDFRYFTHNLKDYVARNGITDIAVCFNVYNAYSTGSTSKIKKMITQKDGIPTYTDSDSDKKGTEATSSEKSASEGAGTATETGSTEEENSESIDNSGTGNQDN